MGNQTINDSNWYSWIRLMLATNSATSNLNSSKWENYIYIYMLTRITVYELYLLTLLYMFIIECSNLVNVHNIRSGFKWTGLKMM